MKKKYRAKKLRQNVQDMVRHNYRVREEGSGEIERGGGEGAD